MPQSMHDLADWLAHYARTRPAQVALRNFDAGEAWTWRELHERASKLSHVLRTTLGLERGDRIVSLTNGDIRYFLFQFACMRAGLVLAPLNFRLAPAELVSMSLDLNPKLMVTDEHWDAIARDVAQKAGIPRALSWGAELDALCANADAVWEDADVAPDAPLLILFTSGTTGKPKAAVITPGGLMWQALNQQEFCGVAEKGCHLFVPIPLFHAGGINSLANPILYFGGEVTISARFEPEATTSYVGDARNKVTHMALVPIMYQMMADCTAWKTADFSCMRTLICAGGRLPNVLQDAYARKGLRFTTQYGGTETGPTVAAMNAERHDKILAGSCGQKAMHVQLRLLDQNGADVPLATPGEICVKGPAVIKTYYGRDPAVDFPDGWFRTGDVAWRDEEGFLYIVDRVKDMYKSGGENVYPAEVEHVLLQHPAVAEAAVIGVAHEIWGEVGLAVVVVRQGRDVTLESLREACEGRLARYKHPKHLIVVDELPRNVTGKVSKPELRARYGGSKSA